MHSDWGQPYHPAEMSKPGLLRAATILLATEEKPQLVFRQEPVLQKRDRKVEVWSNGRDGKNQKGQGNWSSTGQDIV
jgi:hypothetical protein